MLSNRLSCEGQPEPCDRASKHRLTVTFSLRNVVELEDDVRQEAKSGMGVKVSLGTYKMFFVAGKSRAIPYYSLFRLYRNHSQVQKIIITTSNRYHRPILRLK
jgi:hypothetical protein